jgi:hypothetical protein
MPKDKKDEKDSSVPMTDEEKKHEMNEADLEKKVTEFDDLEEEEIARLSELTQKVFRLYEIAKTARRKYDWEWMVRELYMRGYHFAKYSRGTNTITFSTRTGVRIPINLTWALARAVRNQVTSFRPKWEILPAVTTESAIENARYSSRVLDYVYKRKQIKRKLKEVLSEALIKSLGIWEITVDNNNDIVINSTDPFDLYIDPLCVSPNLNDHDYGANFVIKTFVRPVEEIKKDKRYSNTWQIEGGDSDTSSAEYKKFLLQVVKSNEESANDEIPTKMLYECWMREYQDDGSYKMRLVTVTRGAELPIRNELYSDEDYPWEIMQGDITPNTLYGESWAKQIIPINRVIDSLESHIFEYNHFFARGRFVIDKNSGVRIIVNQHGQIIEKNRGSSVTSLPISPLPNAPQAQIANFRRYMEDISGAHDVSLGRLPTGIRSGTGIAELRQADATNQDDLVDNLEDFMSRTGSRILKLISKHWTTSRLISVTGIGGKPEYFMALGDKASRITKNKDYKFGEMRLPLAVIGADNEVNVQVGSWLAYTKAARQEKLKELYRLGAIDQKTLLQYLEFGDIDGILERSRTEKLLEIRAGRPAASAERMGVRDELSDEELAVAENKLMLQGKDMPVEPDDDHEVHISIHQEVVDDQKFGDTVRAHINEHVNMLQWLATNRVPEQGAQPGAEPGAEPGAAPPGGDMAAMMAQMGGGGATVAPPSGQLPQGIAPVQSNMPPIPTAGGYTVQ